MAVAQLTSYLDALGFNLVGYGCTSCIGNSDPLKDEIESAINAGDLTVAAVLSGKRNHRSNLIGIGIIPLEFLQGVTRKSLELTGEESIDVENLQALMPGCSVKVTLTRADGDKEELDTGCRIDTDS